MAAIQKYSVAFGLMVMPNKTIENVLFGM